MQALQKLKKAMGKIDHLFAKMMVGWCVVWGTGCSVYALRGYFRTGYDPSTLLGIILGFLGGELLLMCLRTILKEKKDRNDDGNKGE